MFTNKIYDCLKQYLDRYLFGFDKNSLNMSIIKGNINLKSVNIRPDEANKLIDGLMLPFSLKAGMIGNLHIKFSVLSIWSSPLEVSIDDLFLILGPNLNFVSHEESYIQDEELDESYDSTNVYNIFEHELQIKKKGKNIDKLGAIKDQKDDNDENSLRNNFRNFMKNLKLTINRVHVRFEEDYFSLENPFSIGVVIDKFDLATSDTEWTFEQPLLLNFFRVAAQHLNQENQNQGSIILKELNLTNARIYVNSMSEMFIPTSLWDQTRHLENQIFDAMPLESLNDLMVQAFKNPKDYFYLVSNFSLFANIYNFKTNPSNPKQFSQLKLKLLFTEFDLNVTPQIIDDISRLYEFMQNFSISLDLKQYRPQRRPCTVDTTVVKEDQLGDHVKRKRKLLVRDWFFYVVWYIRLKKLLLNFYSEQIIEQEIEQNKEKYEGLIKAAENGKENLKKYLEEQGKIRGNAQAKEEQVEPRKWDEVFNLFKFQGINLKIFEDYEKYKSRDRQYLPSFEIKLDTLVIDNNSNYLDNYMNKKVYIRDIKLFHTQLQKKSLSLNLNQIGSPMNNNMKPLNTDREGQAKNGPANNRVGVKQSNFLNTVTANSGHSQSISQMTSLNLKKQGSNGQTQQHLKSYRSSEYNDYEDNIIASVKQTSSQEYSYQQNGQNQSNRNQVSFTSSSTTANNSGNSNVQSINNNGQQPKSILDSVFGFKSAFENFFNMNSTNPASSNNTTNQLQQQQQNHQRNNPQITYSNKFDNSNNSTSMRQDNQVPVNHALNAANKNEYKTPSRIQNKTNSIFNSNSILNSRRGGNHLPLGIDDDINQILSMGSPPNQHSSQKAQHISAANMTSKSTTRAAPAKTGLQSIVHKWNYSLIDHEKQTQQCIATRQFIHLYSTASNQPSLVFISKQNINSEKKNQGKIDYSITLANIDMEYCNDIIRNLCDTLLQYKQIHAFRYIPLKNLFAKRENIHRKIELHAPLYLIKKMFITGGRSSTLTQSLQFESGQALSQQIGKEQIRCESSQEEENISDEEERDFQNSRKNIQLAVSHKTLLVGSSSKKKNPHEENQGKKHQALKSFGPMKGSDQMIVNKIIDYERRYALYDVQVLVDFNSVDIIVIPPQDQENSSSVLCKFKVKQNTITLFKNHQESGFDAFGIQFQTLNKFEMYFMFFRSMKSAISAYTSHPVFGQSSVNYFDQLREIVRKNYKQKSAEDKQKKANINEVLGLNSSDDGFDIMNDNTSKGQYNQVFNKEGVKLQQELFGKGSKTQIHGNKSNPYGQAFNNIDSVLSNTPKYSYKELNIHDHSKQQYKILQDKKFGDMVTSQQQQQPQNHQSSEENTMHLQVFSTEEIDEEEKRNFMNDDLNPLGKGGNETESTPQMILGKTTKFANAQSPQSFLSQIKLKQQQQQLSQFQQQILTVRDSSKGLPSLNHNSQKPNSHVKSPLHINGEEASKISFDKAGSQLSNNVDNNKHAYAANIIIPRGRSQQNQEAISSKNSTAQKTSKANGNVGFTNNLQDQQKNNINSYLGSECDEDEQMNDERKEQDDFDVLLHKSMNTQALKKTKSTQGNNDAKLPLSSGMIKINQGRGKEFKMK